MSDFRNVNPQEWTGNVFQNIGKDWMLVSAKKDSQVNTMTASWGGVGILWNKPVAFVFIRPQRYTKEFVDAAETLSLSFFGGEQRDALTLCGSKSGRDIDKFAATGLSTAYQGETPYITQARTAIILKKLYCQQMTPESFLDPAIRPANYPGEDYHYIYVGEILEILEK